MVLPRLLVFSFIDSMLTGLKLNLLCFLKKFLLRVFLCFIFRSINAVLLLRLVPTISVIANTGWIKTNHLLNFSGLAWLRFTAFPNRIDFLFTVRALSYFNHLRRTILQNGMTF